MTSNSLIGEHPDPENEANYIFAPHAFYARLAKMSLEYGISNSAQISNSTRCVQRSIQLLRFITYECSKKITLILRV